MTAKRTTTSATTGSTTTNIHTLTTSTLLPTPHLASWVSSTLASRWRQTMRTRMAWTKQRAIATKFQTSVAEASVCPHTCGAASTVVSGCPRQITTCDCYYHDFKTFILSWEPTISFKKQSQGAITSQNRLSMLHRGKWTAKGPLNKLLQNKGIGQDCWLGMGGNANQDF